MSTVKIIQYVHRPNTTELGLGNTHETYMLIGTDVDLSQVFPPTVDVTIKDPIKGKSYVVKSAKGNEFRVNQMGQLYRDYRVAPGDEIVFTDIVKGNSHAINFSVRNYNRVVLSCSNNGAELLNIDRLEPYRSADDKYHVTLNQGQSSQNLIIQFKEAKRKRKDSPNETDFYSVTVDYNPIANATYYLTLEDRASLLSLPKSEYNQIQIEGSDLGLGIQGCKSIPPIEFDKDSSSFTSALKTKPFLLLAGISGTGKSQKVQELAFMTCPKELREENSTTPGNYCLIEVKPNWHDSTELLGYYSSLSGKYELTKFVRFVYKAIQNQDTPFFVCLDEMNLAPVEQYFAEYLSVLETRKRVFNEEAAIYEILTAPLLDREVFASCCLKKTVEVPKPNSYVLDSHIYTKEVDLYEDKKDEAIITFLKKYGLYIPENLFVIGTVNMDDTTHQFSRKVIDRAFTIEMNGGKMEDMFSPQSKEALEYRDEPVKLEEFKSEFVKAYEVLEDSRFAKYQYVIATKIPALLGDSDGHAKDGSLNGILNKTPFRVSYRVQNELVLYLSTLIERAGFPDDIEPLISEAFLAILLEKVLPRIQGEAKQLETKDGKSNILKDMMGFVKEKFPKSVSVEQQPEGTEDTDAIDLFAEVTSKENKPAPSANLYDQVMTKLDEMDKKLTGYYTNFF